MRTEVVAVLDIGKTNKKIALYDRGFAMVAEERRGIETKIWQGIEVEDTETLWRWFREALKKLAAEYTIRSIAVSAHGATFVLLDEAGELALPVISYTAAVGAEVQEEFYAAFGAAAALHAECATPDIGFCNMAKVLYYIKTRLPESWARAAHGLFYGPYFGHALTGKRGLEPTFPGNHMYFWDFEAKGWGRVARELGADQLFDAPLQAPWESLGVVKPSLAKACGLPEDCQVTLGIHDSNANFLPYLAKGYEDFLLNSTGTWAVLMRPSASDRLSEAQVAAGIFFNQDALARPVATSLLTLGLDYDTFRGFSRGKDENDMAALAAVVAEQEIFIIPGVLEGASAFPKAGPQLIVGADRYPLAALAADGAVAEALGQRYFAALNLACALATEKKLGVCNLHAGTEVFIEGGFAKNGAYCGLLAALCGEQRFALTSMTEGTSFGAAITGWMLAEGKSLAAIGGAFEIETRPIAPLAVEGLAGYRAAYLKAAGE